MTIGVYRPSDHRFYLDYDNDGAVDRIFEIKRQTGTYKVVADDSQVDDGSQLMSWTLSQNYPNPFNPQTVISYSLPNAAHVKLSVINVLGQTVSTPVETDQTAGNHTVMWDASNLSSVYFYKLEAGGLVETRKMLLLK